MKIDIGALRLAGVSAERHRLVIQALKAELSRLAVVRGISPRGPVDLSAVSVDAGTLPPDLAPQDIGARLAHALYDRFAAGSAQEPQAAPGPRSPAGNKTP